MIKHPIRNTPSRTEVRTISVVDIVLLELLETPSVETTTTFSGVVSINPRDRSPTSALKFAVNIGDGIGGGTGGLFGGLLGGGGDIHLFGGVGLGGGGGPGGGGPGGGGGQLAPYRVYVRFTPVQATHCAVRV